MMDDVMSQWKKKRTKKRLCGWLRVASAQLTPGAVCTDNAGGCAGAGAGAVYFAAILDLVKVKPKNVRE